uniref:Uncharacterized protein n=1 Tax=Branchiostoma floridae TaxID=7739 RepID=C3ZC26_BRAFL|eukprot:XP_002593899.1 hypothetical protein BRAFLDRAFT_98195 [Branchiostoma floridae]
MSSENTVENRELQEEGRRGKAKDKTAGDPRDKTAGDPRDIQNGGNTELPPKKPPAARGPHHQESNQLHPSGSQEIPEVVPTLPSFEPGREAMRWPNFFPFGSFPGAFMPNNGASGSSQATASSSAPGSFPQLPPGYPGFPWLMPSPLGHGFQSPQLSALETKFENFVQCVEHQMARLDDRLQDPVQTGSGHAVRHLASDDTTSDDGGAGPTEDPQMEGMFSSDFPSYGSEGFLQPVPDALFDKINKAFNVRLPKEDFDKYSEQYPLFENLSATLSAPKLTPEQAACVDNKLVLEDSKLRKIQDRFLLAARPLTSAYYALKHEDDADLDKDEIAKAISAALVLLGNASFSMSLYRREECCPNLDKDLRFLIAPEPGTHTGHKHQYPFSQDNPKGPLRTHRDTRAHAAAAVEGNTDSERRRAPAIAGSIICSFVSTEVFFYTSALCFDIQG